MKNATKKTYTSEEVAERYNLTAPRLFQFRKGQTINTYETVRGKKILARSYSFAPILEEGKDWEWNGSEVVFFESALKKISKRKANRKYSSPKGTQKVKAPKTKANPLPKGALRVQDIAKEFKVSIQQVYCLRDISRVKPRFFTDYLIQGTDWDSYGGKIAIYKSAKPKIKAYAKALKEKARAPRTKKLTAFVGSKIFRISGADAQRIIDIIKEKHN